MRDDEVVSLWSEVDFALWFVGFVAWTIGIAQQWRLARRFMQKTGTDLYALRSLAERYSVEPWLWLVEAPRVASKMAAIGTTPLADAELEAMRRAFRRWVTVGGVCMLVAVAWFLAPVVWLLATHW